MKLDVLVRYHKSGNLEYLKACINSLFESAYGNINIILGCQDVDSNTLDYIENFFSDEQSKCPKTKTRTLETFHIKTSNNEDLRAVLFMEGLRRRSGTYFAALDYDDIIYSFSYDLLISKFVDANIGLVAGGLHKAVYILNEGKEVCIDKYGYNKRKYFQYELVHHNFLPLHSYVIRGSLLDNVDISFLDDLSMFEDYALLLKISPLCRFDFSLQDCPVGEYRFRKHLPNSTQAILLEDDVRQKWVRCYQIVEEMKRNIKVNISFAELKQIITTERKGSHKELGYEFFDFSKFDSENIT